MSKAKKETGLSITYKKKEDLGNWYQEVLTKSEMIEYYQEVSGCYILRPWSYEVWELVEGFLKFETKKMGVSSCYFPMFVSEAALNREQDHIEDFAPEVAWVTRSGTTDLEKPLAIRPTSETIMYPAYAKWVRSHRDLPLRYVQYCNVVRWEFKSPVPFLRTREFLWQEGHTAWETQVEADSEVLQALEMYARVYEELLAVPVVKGRKSQKEKFAGGDFTTTVEAFIPAAGRAIQGATSHSLGQNFSKMFDISFSGREGSGEAPQLAWQNSWGITTRVLGVMIMVHGDDQGLVLPPRVAPIQVVGVLVFSAKTPEAEVAQMQARMKDLMAQLELAGVRAHFDSRERTAGFKYAHWEQKGVPLRMEMGPTDFKNNQVVFARRDDSSKITVDLAAKGEEEEEEEEFDPRVDSAFSQTVVTLLETIQANMLAKARAERDARTSIAFTMDEFVAGLKLGNLVLAPWCCTTESEDWVKEQTSPEKMTGEAETQGEGRIPMGSAKTLCIPFSQPPMPKNQTCFTGNGKPALSWCLWGRSY
ncbi:proline-tRNA ligase [Batrachochytrium salamandrivorans]|nr:proline-tRNA ligase [Batrachochytrium salamandrivorans]